MSLRVLQNGIGVIGEIPLLLTTITSFCLSILVAITAFLNFISNTLIKLSNSCLPCSCWTFNRSGSTRELNMGPSTIDTNISSTSITQNNEENPCDVGQVNDLITKSIVEECHLNSSLKNKVSKVNESQIESTCRDIQQKIDNVQNGQNEIKQLKNIIKIESEALATLYHDLEAERNASAMAAKETLAMITRLQEEKSIIQMEARQYKRMAEERAIHDQEAIDTLKEIIAKNENQDDNSICTNGASLPFTYDLHLKSIHIDLNDKECVERLVDYFKRMNPKDQEMILELILGNCLKKPCHSFNNNIVENVHYDINEVKTFDVYNSVVNSQTSNVKNSINLEISKE